jgi:hypothetical protein
MKTIFNKLIAIVITGTIITSCDNYLDVNTDPSFPQKVNAEVVFPPIFQEMVRGEVFDSRQIGQYIQNWQFVSANNVWDLHGYAAGSDTGGEKWRSHYYGIGVNLEEAIRDGLENGKYGYVGAAKAIRAWSWQTTTDYHGEMILDQAFDTLRYVFEYDTQEEIYAEAVRLCEEALSHFQQTDLVNTFSRGDLVYGGDRDKWIKFVYAILARNAHHQSNKSTYNPDKVIEYVDKSFASNADNFNVPHTGTNADNSNFNGPLRNNMGNYRQSAFMLTTLRGNPTDIFPGVPDPRRGVMLSASPDGTYRGVNPASGDPASTNQSTQIPNLFGGLTLSNNTQTRPGKFIFQNGVAFPLITYFELQFMKAEAAFIKGDLTTALTAYKNGISAHLAYVRSLELPPTPPATSNLTDATVAAYLASTAVAQTEAELTLSDIMIQKYIALYGIGTLESWVDMRRHHYSQTIYPGFTFPALLFQDNGQKPAYRVRPRFNSEYVWNRVALDGIGGNNPDYHTYEPWFSSAQ